MAEGQGLGIATASASPSWHADSPADMMKDSDYIEDLQVLDIASCKTPRLELAISSGSPPLGSFLQGFQSTSFSPSLGNNALANTNNTTPTEKGLARRDTMQSSNKTTQVGPSELGDFVMRKRSRISVLLEEKRRNHLFDGRRASDIPNIAQLADLFKDGSSCTNALADLGSPRKPSDNYSVLTSDDTSSDRPSLPFLLSSPDTLNSPMTDAPNHVAAQVLNEYSRNVASGTFKVGHKATRSLLTPPLRRDSFNVEICDAEAKGELRSTRVQFEEATIHDGCTSYAGSPSVSEHELRSGPGPVPGSAPPRPPSPPTTFSEILPKQRQISPPVPPPKAAGRSFKTLLGNPSSKALKDVIHGFKTRSSDHSVEPEPYCFPPQQAKRQVSDTPSVIYRPQHEKPRFEHNMGRKMESPFSPAKQQTKSPAMAMATAVTCDHQQPLFTDRGRLFLRIQRLRDIPRSHLFKGRDIVLTLDNGLQTLKTAPIPYDSASSDINHEFELVVLADSDLRVAITLGIDHPPKPPTLIPSIFKNAPPPSPERKKRFSLFTRKTPDPFVEMPPDDEPEMSREDLAILPFLGPHGEFARSYIVQSDYESQVYGHKTQVLLECTNEWKRTPAPFGGLQVEMMFVPRFSRQESLPTSMNSALVQLDTARNERVGASRTGFLSQQGGDCAYWRRRWFVLDNMSLTGHHEETRKVRNVINMYNVNAVTIDTDAIDRRSFRLEFHDGEVLAFYADTEDSAREWTMTLSLALNFKQPQSWTDLVLSQA